MALFRKRVSIGVIEERMELRSSWVRGALSPMTGVLSGHKRGHSRGAGEGGAEVGAIRPQAQDAWGHSGWKWSAEKPTPVSKSPVHPSGLGNRAEPTVPHQLQPLGYSHIPGRVQVVFGSSCAQTRSLAYA